MEDVFGLAVVMLAGLGDRLEPLGMIQRIGIVLGLQANAAALGVAGAALAHLVGVIGGVELHAGTIGVHCHFPAAFLVAQDGTGIAEHLEIVVVTALQVQRIIVRANIPANGFGCAEVHGGAFHAACFSCGDAFAVRRGLNTPHRFSRRGVFKELLKYYRHKIILTTPSGTYENDDVL